MTAQKRNTQYKTILVIFWIIEKDNYLCRIPEYGICFNFPDVSYTYNYKSILVAFTMAKREQR